MTGAFFRSLRALPLIDVLRVARFRRYVLGNSVSLTGLWLQRISVGWLVWQLTGSATWLGLIALAELLPALLVAPLAGSVADRYDRVRLARRTQLAACALAALLAALSFAGYLDRWLLLLLTLAQGAVLAFWLPVRLALIPHLVDSAQLAAATAVNSLAFNLARFIGPALAGVALATAGPGLAFALNAASFLVFYRALGGLDLPPRRVPVAPVRATLASDFADALRYCAGHPRIAPLLQLSLVLSVCLRPLFELLPGFAAALFGDRPQGLALLASAIGAGAIAGGLRVGLRAPRRAEALLRSVRAAIALFAFGLALLAAAALPALRPPPWFAAAAAALAGFAGTLGGVGVLTLLQLETRSELRGRVMALHGMILRAGPAVGALSAGLLADRYGLSAVAFGAGALALLATLLLALRRRRLRP